MPPKRTQTDNQCMWTLFTLQYNDLVYGRFDLLAKSCCRHCQQNESYYRTRHANATSFLCAIIAYMNSKRIVSILFYIFAIFCVGVFIISVLRCHVRRWCACIKSIATDIEHVLVKARVSVHNILTTSLRQTSMGNCRPCVWCVLRVNRKGPYTNKYITI